MKRSDENKPFGARWAETRAQIEELRTVRALVSRLGVRGADVDDVTQEVVMALHCMTSKESTDREASTPIALERRALLWGVARCTVRNHRRRFANRCRAMEGAVHLMILRPEPTPEERMIAREASDHVERAIAALRATQPSLYEVLSRQLAGEKTSAIAEAIGVPEGTAHARLRRARATVDATVQRQAAERKGRANRARLKIGAQTRWS